jgi:regulator of protease activity HflC (stomatin/prohibitin superfamily)
MNNIENLSDLSQIVNGQTITYLILALLIIFFIITGIKTVPEGRAKIVERLGRRHKTIYPGLNIIIPIVDRVKIISENVETIVQNSRQSLIDRGSILLAEQRMDPPSKTLLAKDNSEINVDPVVYFKITEPARIVYDVTDFAKSFETLIETTLRQEVGKYDGDTIVTSREPLGDALKAQLQNAASAWGIQILRVEIEDLSFDEEVTRSLSDARGEELKRRAELITKQAEAEQLTLIADAKRKAAITEAEGVKQAMILEAEGKYEAQKLEAEALFLLNSKEQEGQAQGYAAIAKALQNNPDAIVALETLKAQAQVAESIGNSSNSLIIPTETAGLFGALGSVAKVLDNIKESKNKSDQADN